MANDPIAKVVKFEDGKYISQTLEGHIADVLTVGLHILKRIETRKALGPFDFDTIRKTALTALTFHDYGKHLAEFQSIIKYPTAPLLAGKKISHALYSTILVDSNIGNDLFDWVCALSILTHHSSLHKGLFSGNITLPIITDSGVSSAQTTFESLKAVCMELCGWLPGAVLRREEVDYIRTKGRNASSVRLRDQANISDMKQFQFQRLFGDRLYEARRLYALIHMILKRSDEYASNYFEKRAAQFPSGSIVGSVLKSPKKAYNTIGTSKKQLIGKVDHPLHDFQKVAAAYTGGLALLRAPCGRGKTLAALLYALMQKPHRIVFCLPTQITSNAMVKELHRLMNDRVGFYHGLRKHLEFSEEEQEMIESQATNAIHKIVESVRSDQFYSTPIVVSTVDHLVYSLIKAYPQADIALGNLLSSVVVYDEIHAYESYTLRQILGGMRILHRYGIPQIVMSATLPISLANYCQREFNAQVIEDHEGLEFRPVIIEKRSEDIFALSEEMRTLALQGRKVLIVVNTVARSQQIYKQLSGSLGKGCPIHLYNSLFTPHDRAIGSKSKEAVLLGIFAKEKTGPAILVATQAVEMSLNIFADVLFTDWCPLDALVQRTGRVNRGGKIAALDNRAIICRATKDDKPYFAPYYFGSEGEENLVLKSWNLLKDGYLSHSEAIELVNKVYDNMDLHKEEKVTRLFKESTLYGERINVLGREDDPSYFNIRDDPEKQNLATVSAVPSACADRFKYSLKGIDLYILKVPLYWLFVYPDKFKPLVSDGEEVSGIYEIEAAYNSVEGLAIDRFGEAHTLIV